MTSEFARGFVEATRCVMVECEKLLEEARGSTGYEFELATARLGAVAALAKKLVQAGQAASAEMSQ